MKDYPPPFPLYDFFFFALTLYSSVSPILIPFCTVWNCNDVVGFVFYFIMIFFFFALPFCVRFVPRGKKKKKEKREKKKIEPK